jgi:hypothetical protein
MDEVFKNNKGKLQATRNRGARPTSASRYGNANMTQLRLVNST